MEIDIKNILIIEDDDDIRNDLEKILNMSGYKTMTCNNGVTGLNYAIQFIPDLIICDIMLPKLDGYEILEKIQKNSDTSHIPFLFLSAKSSNSHVREGMMKGADDYITKPYDIDELLNAVEIRIRKKESIASEYNKKINELKTTVHKNLPHEIRTPVNIILGLTEFLIKNYDKTEKNDFLEMLNNVYDAGQRLNRLFENYLFYAKLELINTSIEEKKKLRKSKTPLVLYHLKDLVNTYLKNSGRLSDLEIDLEDSTVAISEYYLSKLIIEIIDNSIKFSKPGTPIKVFTKNEKNFYIINVTDFGRGMTEEQIENIDAYVQFERKVYEQQGTGLGLTIVKHIVDIHNGEFTITSQQNFHTTVEVKLPLTK